MRTFTFTGAFQGEVIFQFKDNGLLECFDMTGAILSVDQQTYLLKHAPQSITDLEDLQKRSVNSKVQEMFIDFEKFWNRYDDKLNSSKKKTEAKWSKMPKSQQQKAYNYLPKYFQNLPQGTRKKYAETYLNAELWNN